MALPLRRGVGSLALRSFSACLRRHVPPAGSPPDTLSPVGHAPILRRPLDPPCRHFAAPPQVNKKPKEDDDDGPRVNDAIRAPFVRLVTDAGHNVVSRIEALQLAARSDMDLVEVHRKSDPPVCKIMDFHKEKYKKEVKEKERLKTKSAIVLRGGENKEVRFKGKTEIKDLMVKADAITRLMERGYRVKCMAMPSGNEGEDLGAPLSRLLELIKDVCIVESGPHLDSKHAYVIVRHVKFATKKGGKKASQAIEDAGKGTRGTASESPVDGDNNDVPIECGSEAGDKAISAQKGGKDHRSKRELNQSTDNPGADRGKVHNINSGGSKTSPDQEPGETNRYAARRPPVRGDDQGFSQRRYPQDRKRDENEGRPAMHDNQRPPEQQNRSVPRFNQGRLPQYQRNERRDHFPLNNNQRQPPSSDSGGPNPTAKSFGIFSAPKPEPRKENNASASKPANTDSPKSYGIFSKR